MSPFSNEPEAGNCRSCGAAVLWAWSINDKIIPLDAEPVPDGNIVLEGKTARVIKGELFERASEGPKYKSHFATCPNSKQWRRSKVKDS